MISCGSRFWPTIDTALRAAACTGGVEVRLMVSCWEHSPGAMFPFLQSLLVLNRPPLNCNINIVRLMIRISLITGKVVQMCLMPEPEGFFFSFVTVQKIFRVPSTEEQKKIPFARVNHAKYMVTDRAVYLGM